MSVPGATPQGHDADAVVGSTPCDPAERNTYGYNGYTQFCENYRRFARQLKRSMRQVHRAGERRLINFIGPMIAPTDGTRTHILVAAPGAWSYACTVPRETMGDWFDSTAGALALAFIDGVATLIVPDNPKARIADSNRYEPRSNNTANATCCPRNSRSVLLAMAQQQP